MPQFVQLTLDDLRAGLSDQRREALVTMITDAGGDLSVLRSLPRKVVNKAAKESPSKHLISTANTDQKEGLYVYRRQG